MIECRPTSAELLAFPAANVKRAQFGQSLIANPPVHLARAPGVVVVNDHQLAVLGKLDVNFNRVSLLLPREVDCG